MDGSKVGLKDTGLKQKYQFAYQDGEWELKQSNGESLILKAYNSTWGLTTIVYVLYNITVNRKNASRELMELFIRVVSKYNALEKYPMKYGTKHNFYHSERHLLDMFGANPDMNITEFARRTGVTKGAISQVVSKLEKKDAVRRYKQAGNEKEVLIRLTDKGREIYKRHQTANDETVSALLAEFRKHPDDKIEFLISMFRWIEDYLDKSRKHMGLRKRKGH
jgi:DNA-binding MarR family transcriptional regulator